MSMGSPPRHAPSRASICFASRPEVTRRPRGRGRVSRRRPAVPRGGWPVLLALVAWLAAGRARAATVLIVPPVSPSAAAAETLSRLHGELLAVGLAVAVATRPEAGVSGGTNPRAWLERLATERGLDAALEIIDGAPQPAVDVWIFSREPGRV